LERNDDDRRQRCETDVTIWRTVEAMRYIKPFGSLYRHHLLQPKPDVLRSRPSLPLHAFRSITSSTSSHHEDHFIRHFHSRSSERHRPLRTHTPNAHRPTRQHNGTLRRQRQSFPRQRNQQRQPGTSYLPLSSMLSSDLTPRTAMTTPRETITATTMKPVMATSRDLVTRSVSLHSRISSKSAMRKPISSTQSRALSLV
jgi:hypothetical protein